MRNPTIAIQCGACEVPVSAVLHPTPETVISCPDCGASDTYEDVGKACFAEVAARPIGSAPEDRPASKWKFRA